MQGVQASKISPFPPANAPRAGPRMRTGPGTGGSGQDTFSAVSSTTNEVCNEESSVPVNSRVTVCPANADTLNVRCT